MAATIAGKGEDSSAEGESKTSVPLKAAESQTSKAFMDSEKINAKTMDSKKEEQVMKKFVDAPLPATNAWAKRSPSETSQAQAMNLDTKQDGEAAVNEKIYSQDDSIKNTSDKAGNGSSTSPEKNTEERPKTEKSAADLTSSKQAIADSSHKKKIKMFGEDFVEAPPPAVNPWKKVSDAGLSLAPLSADQAQALSVVSPITSRKCVLAPEHYYTAETNKKDKEPENVTDETVPTKDVSPVLADESWPTLHEVKVTEPNQTMPVKATKPAKVKENPQTPATAAVVTPEMPSSTSDTHAAKSEETQLLPDESPARKPTETEKMQVQVRNDSGGDDSSKENKESAAPVESNKAIKGKKGSKPKWQKMEIDPPKPDRRNRRSRSQGRENSPRRRDGRRAGDRFNKADSRRSDAAGPESQNWRANMVSQTAAAAASANTVEDAHEEKNKSFPAGRSRGRGGDRGTSRGGRRGGGRGRGGAARDAKSPPFQASANDWHQPEQSLPAVNMAPETIEVMMGMDTNFYIQEQMLNVLGSPPVFYESDSTTYPPETLKHQIEYYFSEDNLVKDLFLRKKMDKQGWVKLELVLSFKKMKELKADHDSLIQVIRSSNKLELSEKEEFVRTLNSPESWPIEDDFKGLPPPPAVQRVAAMSTLHSDAPEFVPGKPFVLRSLVSDVSGSIPDGDNTLDSEIKWTPEDKENDNLLQDTASNLPTISPILSSS